MSGLKNYIKSSTTMLQDKSETSWMATIKRLSIEWRRIQEDVNELNENGIYIINSDNFALFKVMIFKKDAGPYSYIPFCFDILPCRDESGLAYPMCPPIVKFKPFSKKWIHPNLKVTGDVCISALTYSYIGSGEPNWNPMMGIRSIATILSGIIDTGALKMEPGFSELPLTNEKVMDYDRAVQFICMQDALTLYEEDYNSCEDFKDILKKESDNSINNVMTICNDNIGFKKQIVTYAFEYYLDYDRLFDDVIATSCKVKQSK